MDAPTHVSMHTHTHTINTEFRDHQNPHKFAAHSPLLSTNVSKSLNHCKLNYHEGNKDTTFG